MKLNKIDLVKMDLFRIVRRYISDKLAYALIQILDFDKILKLIEKFKVNVSKYYCTFLDESITDRQNLKAYLSDLEKICKYKQIILNYLQPLSN